MPVSVGRGGDNSHSTLPPSKINVANPMSTRLRMSPNVAAQSRRADGRDRAAEPKEPSGFSVRRFVRRRSRKLSHLCPWAEGVAVGATPAVVGATIGIVTMLCFVLIRPGCVFGGLSNPLANQASNAMPPTASGTTLVVRVVFMSLLV